MRTDFIEMKIKVTFSTLFRSPSFPPIWWLGVVFCLSATSAMGLTFELPKKGDIVGEVKTTTVRKGESLGEIGRRFDVGVYEMIEANPRLDPWLPPDGAIVVIPTEFILPKYNKTGMILNLAEMRLYYFDLANKTVTTYPLGIGKKGWSTPLGKTIITKKRKDPPWYPPESIRQEHEKKGDPPLPPIIPGGTPENPLGRYALYLETKGLAAASGAFLIHGTNRPAGVGVRVTHGCIRLFPEDIEKLYYQIPKGTPVEIIHEPYKVGWKNKRLYLEAHQPLSEPKYARSNSFDRLTKIIEAATKKDSRPVDWASAKLAAKTANGYPVKID